MRTLALIATVSLALGCAGRDRPPALANSEGNFIDAGNVGFQGVDAIPVNIPDCGGSEATLRRRRAAAILVIDRSGSMRDRTRDATPISKWDALVNALNVVLPQVDQAVELGLLLFPSPRAVGGTTDQVCRVDPALEIAPMYGNAATILRALRFAPPGGGTPTSAALQTAAGWYLRATDRDGERYMILATDGGPNCVPDADPMTCRCTGPRETLCNLATNSAAPINCLDETRPVSIIREAATAGVPTYVLGLPGTEDFADVLESMAVAGMRPRATSPSYYPVSSAAELATEFRQITTTIAECRFALETPPPDPDLVDVRLDGASIYRDVTHTDGWDWSSDNPNELRFYGRSCGLLQAASGGSRLRAVFGCPAPTPP